VSSAGLWLVAYDVTAQHRLARLHRLLVRRGAALQYSVFLVRVDRPGLAALTREIATRIHPRADDVRLYPIRPTGLEELGADWLPAGVVGTLLPPRPRRGLSPAGRGAA
jgi:CRISPR-associated endonuclease Cas2